MKRIEWVKLVKGGGLMVLAVACILSVPSSRVSGAYLSSSPNNQITLRLRAGATIDRINTAYGTYIASRIPGTSDYLLGVYPGITAATSLSRMQTDASIEFADWNNNFEVPEVRQVSQAFIDSISTPFIDKQSPSVFYSQKATDIINLPEAHALTRGGGVRVAVIDTGIDLTHPLFAGRLVGPYYDFIEMDGDPYDAQGGAGTGHGTFVAGLIALVAPDAMILPIRAFDKEGRGTSFNIAWAIRYAVDNGAKVINMSFGLATEDKLIRSALDYANGKAFMVASAGNSALRFIEYPAGQIDRVFSVSATTELDRLATFSNYHENIDLAAPGVQLYSAHTNGRWAWWSGTSFSTALVSGGAALVLAIFPSIDIGVDLPTRIQKYSPTIKQLYSKIKRDGKRLDLMPVLR